MSIESPIYPLIYSSIHHLPIYPFTHDLINQSMCSFTNLFINLLTPSSVH